MTQRTCRAHDADDPVEGRVCGRRLPCPDHPRGWNGARLKPVKQVRVRSHSIFTLSDEARRRLREMAQEQSRPASRVLEDLILAGRS